MKGFKQTPCPAVPLSIEIQMSILRLVLVIAALGSVNTASAIVTTYTDSGMFESDVGAGALTTVDFEGITTDANLVLSDGDSATIPGLTFTYGASLTPDTLVVTDGSDIGTDPTTTSEDYYLGSNVAGSGDFFESNHSFTVTFDTNVTAVGLSVIVPADFPDGFFDPDEVTLSFGGGTIGNILTTDVAPDGTSLYFLGIEDTAGTFNSFTLTGNIAAFGSDFGVDDIRFAPVVAVPEPTSFAILCVAGVGISVNRRRRK
jgi:hypothetical protein